MTKQEELHIAQKAFKELLCGYQHSERMMGAMASYIYENSSNCDMIDNKMPDNYKLLRNRYRINIYGSGTGLAWYLLEKYFAGKLEIK